MATAAQSTAVATRPTNSLAQFREELEERAAELRMALPVHISPDKFQRTVVTAVQQNPSLLKADRRSLVLACMKAAQSGLLPDGREAALVIFKNRKKVNGEWKTVEEVAFIEMVYGVRKKILQARDADGKPVVSGLEVNPVYRKEVEAGHFIYEVGMDPPLRHRPMLDLTLEDTEDRNIIAAYSIATMADGTKSYKFMRRFQIDKIQETSKTGATHDRQGNKRQPSGPWVDWYPAMVEKTVLKQHGKSLPQSGDLILEADDDDSYAGRSAAALLSVPGGEPQAIEDHSEDDADDTPDHDPETGEIIETDADVAGDNTSAEPVKETAKSEPEAKAEKRRAEAETHAALNPTAEHEAEEEREPTPAEEAGLDAAHVEKSDPQSGEDQVDHNAKADQIIGEIKDANAIVDVNSIGSRHRDEIHAMPDALREAVENAAKARKAAIEAERAKAKQAELAK